MIISDYFHHHSLFTINSHDLNQDIHVSIETPRPYDGTVLSLREPSEVVQVLQGGLLRTISQLHHFGERLSGDGLATNRVAIEDLTRQFSEEKDQRLARELEIRDLKNNVKDLEKTVKTSSAYALAPEVVMAVSGDRSLGVEMVIACWELMREWQKKQSNQWELAKAFKQYKSVMLVESRSKGVDPPSFEDEPPIPPASKMDVE
ncbi:hypothetical protein Bca4012_020414 [Brassica carinata]